jgi:hypothetical protein
MKLLPVRNKTEEIVSYKEVNFYDYNYSISKKFKYLKTEATSNSDVLIFLVNIYEKVIIS